MMQTSNPDVSSASSAICPGSKNLFEGMGKHYLRVVFTVYWMDAMPSTEVFYFTQHPIRLNPHGIQTLQQTILDLLKSHNKAATPMNAVYVCYSGVELDDADITSAGWHIVAG
jgi:hypothetical protein